MQGFEMIVAEPCTAHGLGAHVKPRVSRSAAAHHIPSSSRKNTEVTTANTTQPCEAGH